MKPFEVYRLYLALKLHFTTPGYDITKTKGAVKANYESFLRRKDLTSIRKLARDYKRSEVIELLVSNFIVDECANIFDSQFTANYKKWLTTQQRMLYNFNTDLDNILFRMEKDQVKSAMNEGTHPLIFRMYMGRDVNLETLVMLEKLRPFVSKYKDDFVLESVCLLISKYKPFVRFDKDSVNQKHMEKLDLIYGDE